MAKLFNNTNLFAEMLYQRRRTMGEANRRKSARPRRQQWIYPHNTERKYAKRIKEILKPLIERSNLILQANLKHWTEEYVQSTQKIDAAIRPTVDELQASIRKIDTFRSDQFPDELTIAIEELEEVAKRAAEENLRTMIVDVGYDTSEQNLKQWSKFSTGVLGLQFFPAEPWEADVIKTWGQTNFNLIKSLQDEYIKKLNLIVSEGVQQASTAKSLEAAVADMLKESKKLSKQMITGRTEIVNGKRVKKQGRAELIARDQVGKLTESFTRRRQLEAGIDMYIWATAGDRRVRPTHKPMNGKLCRWDDPTVFSPDSGKTWVNRSTIGGVQLHPGQDIQCRCTAIPYFDDLISETDKKIKEE